MSKAQDYYRKNQDEVSVKYDRFLGINDTLAEEKVDPRYAGYGSQNFRLKNGRFCKRPGYSLTKDLTNALGWVVSGSNTYTYKADATPITGTADSTKADSLMDSGATFSASGVLVGDTVRNTTDDTITSVTVVVSDTELTLAADIFVDTEAYEIEGHIPDVASPAWDTGASHTPDTETVENGILTVVESSDVTGYKYVDTNLDNSVGTTLKIKLKASVTGSTMTDDDDYVFFQIWDGTKYITLTIYSNKIKLAGSPSREYTMNTIGTYHIYHLILKANTARVYVDGVCRLKTTPTASANQWLFWSFQHITTHASAYVDYVTYTRDAVYPMEYVKAMYEYKTSKGYRSMIAQMGAQLIVSEDLDNWEMLYEILNENYRCHFATYLSKCYICNGYNSMLCYDGNEAISSSNPARLADASGGSSFPVGKYIDIDLNRNFMIVACLKDTPNTLTVSSIVNADGTVIAPDNYLAWSLGTTIELEKGGDITGVKVFKNMIVVTQFNYITVLIGEEPLKFTKRVLKFNDGQECGCVSQESLQIKTDLKEQDHLYGVGKDKIWRWSGSGNLEDLTTNRFETTFGTTKKPEGRYKFFTSTDDFNEGTVGSNLLVSDGNIVLDIAGGTGYSTDLTQDEAVGSVKLNVTDCSGFDANSASGTTDTVKEKALIDAANSHFTLTMVGEAVENNVGEFSYVAAYVSTSELTLNDDIFQDPSFQTYIVGDQAMIFSDEIEIFKYTQNGNTYLSNGYGITGAYPSGTYIGQGDFDNTGNLASGERVYTSPTIYTGITSDDEYGTFEADWCNSGTNCGGTIIFYVRSATTEAGLSSASWHEIGIGERINESDSNDWFQWRAFLTRSDATHTPILHWVKIMWIMDGAWAGKIAGMVYENRYMLAMMNIDSNDRVLIYDENDQWLYDKGKYYSAWCMFNNILYSGDSKHPYIYKDEDTSVGSDNGSNITFTWMGHIADFGDSDREKVVRKGRVSMETDATLPALAIQATHYWSASSSGSGVLTVTPTAANNLYPYRFLFPIGNGGNYTKFYFQNASTSTIIEVSSLQVEAKKRTKL